MSEFITLNHGSGGRQAHKLIKDVFARRFGMEEPFTDSATVAGKDQLIAFTTDSYVVDPLFFPGGNIGKLAICGTVNDLAVSGAEPAYLSASFIIEEGFPLNELVIIADSMAEEASRAGVRIVTGDTKVVEKGKCDRLFITTSGTGFLKTGRLHISRGELIRPGDKLLINGPLGNHAIAVLGARNVFNFTSPVISDCTSLNHLIKNITEKSDEIHFMRDLTRGGLATVLNELREMIQMGITINEESIPVDEPVTGLCEVFGFDPLYLANEGKLLIVTGRNGYEEILEIMRLDPAGTGSVLIGEITADSNEAVVMNTASGGRRAIDVPSGVQLPRIC